MYSFAVIQIVKAGIGHDQFRLAQRGFLHLLCQRFVHQILILTELIIDLLLQIYELLRWWYVDHSKIKTAVDEPAATNLDTGLHSWIPKVIDDFLAQRVPSRDNKVIIFNVNQSLVIIQEIPKLDVYKL